MPTSKGPGSVALVPLPVPQVTFHRDFSTARRIVVKVGSAVLAPAGDLSEDSVGRLVADLAQVAAGGRQVVLVSSGAVASGFRALGLDKPPKEIMLKQAAAAIGQQRLMRAYAEAFAFRAKGTSVAQVLLTAEDLGHRRRFLNARHTLDALLEHNVVPIINENDSVSFEEIKLGDNDRLASLVAGLVGADVLVILSTVRGVYERGDARRVIDTIAPSDDATRHVKAEKSGVGTGGMATKLAAAATAGSLGVPTVIACGLEPNIVSRVLAGERTGTYFPTAGRRTASRKHWIGFSARAKGAIVVDDGAKKALLERHASLLPTGVRSVVGVFEAGVPVEIQGADGESFAKGLVGYSSAELEQIKGKRASQIVSILGYTYRDEVVHRDDLAVIE